MGRHLWSVIGIVAMIIGIGGHRDDLHQWAQWLNINDISSDIWWTILLVLGLFILLLNLIPNNVWAKLIQRLPQRIKRKLQKIPSDKITAFYNTRMSLNQKYRGIQEELTISNKILAAWHGATVVAHEPQKRLKKVEKLLLMHPESKILDMYVCAAHTKNRIQDLQSDILFATEVFQEVGTKVKWFDGLFNLITINDPDTANARARVEVWMFEESDKRQNYVIDKRANVEAYNGILDSFNKMWNDTQWSHEPPDDLNEFRRKLGLDTPSSSPQST